MRLCLPVETIIVCAGQEPQRALYDDAIALGLSAERVGGAYQAMELDAKAAISQASRSAALV